MDKLNYRELVQEIIKNHVGNSLNANTEVQLIFDTERDRTSSMENFPLRYVTHLSHNFLQQCQLTACSDAKPKKAPKKSR